jgi:hypothetical protein
MKSVLLYLGLNMGAVALLVGLPTLVLTVIMRRKSELWRALFGAEVVLLFLSLGNCSVPGSWKDFRMTESVSFGLATIAALWSLRCSRRSKWAPARYRSLVAPQVIALVSVAALISILVISA